MKLVQIKSLDKTQIGMIENISLQSVSHKNKKGAD